jgi:hypothetical protein
MEPPSNYYVEYLAEDGEPYYNTVDHDEDENGLWGDELPQGAVIGMIRS